VNAPLSKTTVNPVAIKILPAGTVKAFIKAELPRLIPDTFMAVNRGYVDVYAYAEFQLALFELVVVKTES
jgi:hypothetical protein